MKNDSISLTIAIRHYPEDGRYTVGDIDIGPLIAGLVEEPRHLARCDTADGTVRLQIERTHEWEIVVGIAIAGVGAFTTGIISTLGKRIGNWIADWCERQLTSKPVEIRDDAGASELVAPADTAANRERYTQLIGITGRRGGTVAILFPW